MSDPLQRKPETPDSSPLSSEAADEYALQPEKPALEPRQPQPDRIVESEPPDNPEERQFSLAELLGLVAVVSVVLSILASIARWSGIDKTPSRLAAFFAGGLGFVALITMVVLAFFPNTRRIVLVGWWMLLGIYIIAAVAATLMPR